MLVSRICRLLGALLLCGCALRQAAPPRTARALMPAEDSDRDGVPDEVELRTGTDPGQHDTDGDGIPDGVEDRNQDGLVDPGESDPRIHGLFPGVAPHIPEPLVFDLVRGLGARPGELESNVLFARALGTRSGLWWAPELEYAFARDHAIEIEIPIRDRTVSGVKAAIQGALPGGRGRFIHGWQLIAEYVFDHGMEGTPLYLAGVRLSPVVSLFGMIGARVTWVPDAPAGGEFIFNPSVFFDFTETLTVGVESNLWVGGDGLGLRVIPQLHVQVGRHVRLQAGVGLLLIEDRLAPLAALRLVAEK